MVQGLEQAADKAPLQQNCELTQLSKAVARELDNADVNGVLKVLEQAKKEFGLPGLKLVVEGAEKLETNHVGLDLRLSQRPHTGQSALRGDNLVPEAHLTMDAKLLYFRQDTSDANIARIKEFLDQAAGEHTADVNKQLEASVPEIAANWVELIKHGQGSQFSQWAADVMNKAERAEYLTDHGRRHEEVMGKEVLYRTVEEMQKLMPREAFAQYLPHRDIQQTAEGIKDSVENNRFNNFRPPNNNNNNNSQAGENERLLTDAEISGNTWVPAVAFKGFSLEQTPARVALLQDEKARYEKCMNFPSGGNYSDQQQQCSEQLHNQLDRKRS